ncbi:MAG: radical SAM family heme chaperone HemW [Cyanobium sp.]
MPDSAPIARPGLPPVKPRSAYLHIPFCHRRCFYCDFAVVPLGDRADGGGGPGAASIESYLALLLREIRESPSGPPLSTIYLGGGTPSMLTPIQVASLVLALQDRYGLAPGAEITLEMDPATFDDARLHGYLTAGINRVSLGGQSFDDAVLRDLGRRHSRNDLLQAAGWLQGARARGALASWSLDLLQALPGQDLPRWREQLEQAIAVEAPHLSVYDLIVEPGTVFERRQRRGELALPEEDLGADLMLLTAERLAAAGYGHYEVSNYALPGHACRHNRVYWSGAHWWGFGMGATGSPDGVREARPRQREAYATWLNRQRPHAGGVSAPTEPEQEPDGSDWEDRWLVGLRRREGVQAHNLFRQAGVGDDEVVALRCRLERFERRGLLRVEGPRWRLSDPEGLALSNAVLRELLLWWEERQGRGR